MIKKVNHYSTPRTRIEKIEGGLKTIYDPDPSDLHKDLYVLGGRHNTPAEWGGVITEVNGESVKMMINIGGTLQKIIECKHYDLEIVREVPNIWDLLNSFNGAMVDLASKMENLP